MSGFITVTWTLNTGDEVKTFPGVRVQVRHILAYYPRWTAKPERGSAIKMTHGMDYDVAETAEQIDELIKGAS